MQKKFNRLLAVVLVFIMGLTFLPVTAFASLEGDTTVVSDGQTLDQPGGSTDDTPADGATDTPTTAGGETATGAAGSATLEGAAPPKTDPEKKTEDTQQPAETTYTVEFLVPGRSGDKRENLAADAAFPPLPEGTEGYSWYRGGSYNVTYKPGELPATIGADNWVLEGIAPVQDPKDGAAADTKDAAAKKAVDDAATAKGGIDTQGVDDEVVFTFCVGAETVEKTYIAGGSFGELPEDPQAPAGQEFMGWFENAEPADGEQPYDFTQLVPTDKDALSLYAVFAPKAMGNVKFMVGGEVYHNEDVAIGSTVTAPAAPPIPGNMVSFRGWFANAIPAEGEQSFDFSTTITAEGLTLYAVFSSTYLVKFYDGNGQVAFSREVLPGRTVNEPDDSDMALVQGPEGTHFQKWHLAGDETQIIFPYTVNKDTDIHAKFGTEYTVYFISAGDQVEPASVKAGEKLSKPSAPGRQGYTFKEWVVYGTETPYDFEQPVNSDLFLEATWNPGEVKYTVVFWMEKANMFGADESPTPGVQSHYDAIYTVERTNGISGQKPNLTNSSFNNEMAVDPLKYATIQEIRSPELSGAGTSIVNVYCARKVYEFVFDFKMSSSSGNPNQLEVVFGNGEKHTASSSNNATYTLRAKYEEAIVDRFPFEPAATITSKRGNTNYYLQHWVTPSSMSGSSNWLSIRPSVSREMLSTNGSNAKAYKVDASWTSSSKMMEGRYYLQALPHETPTHTYSGMDYVEWVELRQIRPSTSSWSAKFIEGMEDSRTTLSSESQIKAMSPVPYKSDNKVIDRAFLYRREIFSLSFVMNATNAQPKQIATRTGIMYQERLGNYKPADPTRPGYIFKGWYLDEDFLTPVVWEGDNQTTMPIVNKSTGLQVFAKWESTELTVSYIDTVENSEVFSQGYGRDQTIVFPTLASEVSGHAYEVGQPYGGKGTFLGWGRYISGNLVAISTEVPVGQVVDKDGKLTLYSMWRTTGFTLTYNKGEGSGEVPTETTLYALNAMTRVQDGSSLNPPEGKLFYAWLSNDNKLYYPGGTLTFSGDVTLTAQYAAKGDLIDVIYHSNDSQNDILSTRVGKGAKAPLAGDNAFIRDGQKLLGWNTEANKGNATPEFEPGEVYQFGDTEMHFYACWGESDVVVQFHIVGDEGYFPDGQKTTFEMAKDSLWSDEVTEVPTATPKDSTVKFVGWTTDPAGMDPAPVVDYAWPTTEKVTSDLHYYAVFAKKAIYNVTLRVHEDSIGRGTLDPAGNTYQVYEGDALRQAANGFVNPLPAANGNTATKGYRFVKWTLDGADFDDNTNDNYDFGVYMPNGSVVFEAHFVEYNLYTVQFVNLDGVAVATFGDIIEDTPWNESTVVVPSAPTPPNGYVFLGWVLDSKSDGSAFVIGTAPPVGTVTPIDGNLIYKPVFAPLYSVQFQDAYGEVIASATVPNILDGTAWNEANNGSPITPPTVSSDDTYIVDNDTWTLVSESTANFAKGSALPGTTATTAIDGNLVYKVAARERKTLTVQFIVNPDQLTHGDLQIGSEKQKAYPATGTFEVKEGLPFNTITGFTSPVGAPAASDDFKYVFSNWTLGVGGATISGEKDYDFGGYSVTENAVIVANFNDDDAIPLFWVDFIVNPAHAGLGTLESTEPLPFGAYEGTTPWTNANITVPTPVPTNDTRYRFTGWTLGEESFASNDALNTAWASRSIDKSLTFVANFEEDDNVQVDFIVTGPGTIGNGQTAMGPYKAYTGSTLEGSGVTVPGTAPNDTNSYFVGWFVGGTNGAGGTKVDIDTVLVGNANTTYEARFAGYIPLTITAGRQSFPFTGKTYTSADMTTPFTYGALNGNDVLVEAEVEVSGQATYKSDNGTEAAETHVTPASVKIMRGDVDVTGEYKINYEAGALTITNFDPGAGNELVYRVEAQTKPYVGAAYDYDTNGALFIKTGTGESATYAPATLAGEVTTHRPAKAAGTNADSYDMAWVGTAIVITHNGKDVTDHFSIEYEKGNFTITKAEVTLTANPSSVVRGRPTPTLTYAASGFVGGDAGYNSLSIESNSATLAAVLGFNPVLATGYDPAATNDTTAGFDIDFDAATKAIVAPVEPAPDNYTIQYVPSEFTTSGGGSGLEVTDSFRVLYFPNQTVYTGSVPVDGAFYATTDPARVKGNENGLAKAGLTLVGWNTKADGTGTGYDLTGTQTITIGNANVELYGVWEFASGGADFTLAGFNTPYTGGYHTAAFTGTLLEGDVVTLYAADGTTVLDTVTVGEGGASGLSLGGQNFKDVADTRNGIYATVNRGGVVSTTNTADAIISKVSVAITIASDAKAYDGTALTLLNGPKAGQDVYSVTGLVGDDKLNEATLAALAALGSESILYKGEKTLDISVTPGTTGTDGNYDIGITAGKLTINPVSITITSASRSWPYDGASHQDLTYTLNGTSYRANEDITALFGFASNHVLNVAMSSSVKDVKDSGTENNLIGSVSLKLGNDDVIANGSVVLTTVAGDLAITAKKITISTNDREVKYDGSFYKAEGFALAADSTLEGNDSLSGGSATSSRWVGHADVGSYQNVFTSYPTIVNGTQDVTGNYDITWDDDHYLTITQRTLYLYVDEVTYAYNGAEQTKVWKDSEIKVSTSQGDGLRPADRGGVQPHSIKGTATATGTNAGDYTFSFADVKVQGLFQDMSNNYKIEYVSPIAQMHILPAALHVTSASETKEFDNTPLTNGAYEVVQTLPNNGGSRVVHKVVKNADGTYSTRVDFADFFNGQTITVPVTGTITNVSENADKNNTIGDVTVSGAASNFTIGKTQGTLKITEKDITIIVDDEDESAEGNNGGSATKVYDGTGLNIGDNASVKVTGLDGLTGVSLNTADLLALLQAQEITYVHQSPEMVPANVDTFKDAIVVTGTEKTNFTFTVNQGTLTITPATITVKANDASKTYDNTPLTDAGYSASYNGKTVSAPAIGGDLDISGLGFAGAHTLKAAASGTITEFKAGGEENTLTVTAIDHDPAIYGRTDGKDSIEVTPDHGTLTILKRSVTVRANSAGPFTWDGATHHVNGYSVLAPTANTGLVPGAGHTLANIDAGAAASAVGNWPAEVRETGNGWQVLDSSNAVKTHNYNLLKLNGNLEIVDGTTPPPVIPPVVPPVEPPEGPEPPEPEPPEPDIPEEIIPTPPTPEAEGDEVITPPTTPEAPSPVSTWALLNLLVAVLCAVFAVLLFVGIFKRNKKAEEDEEAEGENVQLAAEGEEEDEETQRNPKSGIGWRILSILAGVAAPIIFFLTENLRNPMVFTDRWTLLMVIVLVIQVIGMLLLRRARNQEEDEDNDEQQTPSQA